MIYEILNMGDGFFQIKTTKHGANGRRTEHYSDYLDEREVKRRIIPLTRNNRIAMNQLNEHYQAQAALLSNNYTYLDNLVKQNNTDGHGYEHFRDERMKKALAGEWFAYVEGAQAYIPLTIDELGGVTRTDTNKNGSVTIIDELNVEIAGLTQLPLALCLQGNMLIGKMGEKEVKVRRVN